jgi:Fur family zinc uptake transcriptional regulator
MNGIDKTAETLGFATHDHQTCVKDCMASVETRCAAEHLRFTPVRRKTLEILLQEHRALGAYDVLERLQQEGFGSQPPVAYRALDFLVKHGFAHKIERLNAFVACTVPDASHTPAFMICRSCETVAEVEGLCPTCVDKTNA